MSKTSVPKAATVVATPAATPAAAAEAAATATVEVVAPVAEAAAPVVTAVGAVAVVAPAPVAEVATPASPVVPVVPAAPVTPPAITKKVAYTPIHFKRSEFACPCCGVAEVSDELLQVLDDVREHFNSPVTVTSGYRCEEHNLKVDGKPGSKHKDGIAADIQVSRIPPRTVQKYLLSKYPEQYGLGCYRTFTHVDVRPTKARW
jgi:hypothetical protein